MADKPLFNQLVSGVYEVPLGIVNVWLIESADGLVLIDTGMATHGETILKAVQQMGKQPSDIKHILISHAHPDHFGSLATLVQASSAQTYVHAIDAPRVRKGGDFNPKTTEPPFYPTPRFIPGLLFPLLIKPYYGIEPSAVDHEITEGDTLDFLPDLKILFTPGHSMGHLAFLWEKDGGVLFAVDTCAHLPLLDWSLGYEDFEMGQKSLKRLCEFDFNVVTFGHGKPITKDASTRWRKRWGKL